VGAEGGDGGAGVGHVLARREAGEGGGALGRRGEQQRPVRDRLVTRHAHPAPHGGRTGDGQRGHGSSRGRRATTYLRRWSASARRAASADSTSSSMTPWSPSAEWASSRSAMLTSSSVARVVTSASEPGRSGTG